MNRLPFIAILLTVMTGTGLSISETESSDQIIYDKTIKNWVVDRFAGNTKAGAKFYQGLAREVGGLQRPQRVVETPEGVYIAAHEEGADNPNLYLVQSGMLRIVMEREGAVEGPIELCQGGFPIWNEHDNTLYLTGPYCIRKVNTAPDGFRTVEVVAGTPHVKGSADGPALRATLNRPRGWAATQDGAIYWLENRALRKFAKGEVSTVDLKRPETPGWLWKLNPGEHLLSAGEDAHTLYVSNYYDTIHGYSILKVDLATNHVRRITGVDHNNPNHGKTIDGPPTSKAAFRGGARGIYHPDYHALFLDGADPGRYRWQKLDGDNWVRTLFGKLLPGTKAKPFGIQEANSVGIEGEQFRLGDEGIIRFLGTGKNGGVYVGGLGDQSGVWRAYDNTVGSSIAPSSTSSVQGGKGSRIKAALIGSNGQLLQKAFEIAPSAVGVQAHPRVAYCDGTFLVVWHDLRNGSDFDVLGVRIASDGTVLDASPLPIGTGARTQTMPDVTASDRGFMVVWGGFRKNDQFPHVFAAHVDSDGTVRQTTIIAEGASPRVAWNSYEKKYFVLYASAHERNMGPTTNWLVMDVDKTVSPRSSPFRIYGGGRDPNHFSVCAIPQASQGWMFITDHQPGNLWKRSIGMQRSVNITPGGSIAPDSPTAKTKSYIESYRLKPGGGAANWLDFHRELEREWPYGGNAAFPDQKYCVAIWGRYHIGGMTGISLTDSDLYASRVDRWAPVETSPVAVATSSLSERNPSLAGNGNGKLVVVYEKLADGASQIATRPLTISSKINVGSEEVITGSTGTRRGFPDIVYGGNRSDSYMVVWQEGWHGAGNFLSPAGTSISANVQPFEPRP